jgi:hypothetical protein
MVYLIIRPVTKDTYCRMLEQLIHNKFEKLWKQAVFVCAERSYDECVLSGWLYIKTGPKRDTLSVMDCPARKNKYVNSIFLWI